MAAIFCTSRFAFAVQGQREHWRAHYSSPPRAASLHQKLPSLAFTILKHGSLCTRIRASSSDLGDPERVTGEDYIPASRYGGGDFEGDALALSQESLSEKVEAASQLSESVPTAAVNQLEEGGGGDGVGNSGGGGGGGGDGDGASGGSEDKDKKMSASQKLTLAYAALVGVGGAMGYVKSKSTKSLISGAISSLVLYYVYTQLPSNPVFASSLGLGVSAVLLIVMGTRFKKSGKLFPAGVVSLVSLIMTGGYIHGIMRSSHA